MRRTQIYLTEEERLALKALSEREGRSQSEIIREAVDRYLQQAEEASWGDRIHAAAGLWKDRDDLPDPRTLRQEWEARRPAGADRP